MEDAKALKLFNQALEQPGNSDEDRAKIHIYMGIAYFNLMRQNEAGQHFQKALEIDAKAQIPPMTAPKIKALFYRVRNKSMKHASSPAATTPNTGGNATLSFPPMSINPSDDTDSSEPKEAAAPLTSSSTPASSSTDLPKKKAPEDKSTAASLDQRAPSKSSIYWPGWITLGSGLAAGSVGLILGLSARSENNNAQDLSLPYSLAQKHRDTASNRALAANILLVGAGAAIITSGILFYYHHRNAAHSRSATKVASSSTTFIPSFNGKGLLLLHQVAW